MHFRAVGVGSLASNRQIIVLNGTRVIPDELGILIKATPNPTDGQMTAIQWERSLNSGTTWTSAPGDTYSTLNVSDPTGKYIYRAWNGKNQKDKPVVSGTLYLVSVDYSQPENSSFPTGVDDYTVPHWIMVPQYGSNSAQAITSATTTLPISFYIEPDGSQEGVSPSNTTKQKEVIYVNSSAVDAHDGSAVSIAPEGVLGKDRSLQISVKEYQLITVGIHAITQVSGTTRIEPNAPLAGDLESYLNCVYGPQTNTYFYVDRKDYEFDFDPTGTVDLSGSTLASAAQVTLKIIRETAQNTSRDFNIYYVPHIIAPSDPATRDSCGLAYYLAQDTIIDERGGLLTAAHEIGHLFGLGHRDVPANGLMLHITEGCFLLKEEWDVINPYTKPK